MTFEQERAIELLQIAAGNLEREIRASCRHKPAERDVLIDELRVTIGNVVRTIVVEPPQKKKFLLTPKD